MILPEKNVLDFYSAIITEKKIAVNGFYGFCQGSDISFFRTGVQRWGWHEAFCGFGFSFAYSGDVGTMTIVGVSFRTGLRG